MKVHCRRVTRVIAAAAMVVCALAAAPARAQNVPTQLHFQGRLTDSSNNPLTGPNGFVFGVYDAPTGGSLLWSETQPAVSVANGVFAVQLGVVDPLASGVFVGSTTWLQVTVNGNVMLPRQRLLAAPYAHNAQLLSGREFSAFVSTDAASQNIAGAKTFLNLVSVSSDLVVTGALTASSGTFTASGPSQFSLKTSSGVSVGGTGGVYAPFFSGSFYGSGAGITGITAAPGGVSGQVQFNNGGVMGGAANLSYDAVNGRLGVGTAAPQSDLQISGPSGTSLEFDVSGSMIRIKGNGKILVNIKP